MSFFDPGPLLPPFTKEIKSIDCRFINVTNMSALNGEATLSLDIVQSFEYPTEYLPHFINISLFTKFSRHTISSRDYYQFQKKNKSVSFSFKIPVGGQTTYEVKCLGDTSHQNSTFLPNPANYSDSMSSAYFPDDDSVWLTNFCFVDGRFLVFGKIDGGFYSLPLNNSVIEIVRSSHKIQNYVSYKNYSINNQTHHLLFDYDMAHWRQILLSLGPLSRVAKANRAIMNKLLMWGFSPKGCATPLKPLFANPPSKIKNGTCYGKMIFPMIDPIFEIKDNNRMQSVLKHNLSGLRSAYIKEQPNGTIVAIANELKFLNPIIMEVCPNCTIEEIYPLVGLMSTARKVGLSRILIGNHLTNLIHMVWMEPNISVVLDITPPCTLR